VKTDVVVVGGGLVGCALACALAETGLQIAIVEAKPLPAAVPGRDVYDYRVSALTHASRALLEQVGAWRHVDLSRVAPFREMHVWDAGGGGAIHFDSADIGEASLGCIVENDNLQRALLARLGEADGVTWFRPESVRAMHVGAHDIRIQLDTATLSARLAIGADGTHSPLRGMAGIECARVDYEQRALVATVSTEKPHADTAWQRFLPNGPLAFLPLPGQRCSIVWSTTPAQADDLLGLDERCFADELAYAFEAKLGAITWVGERGAFPLTSTHANSYIGERLVLVGDAAHTIHPLAGQGVNLGFLDVGVLAEVLGDALAAGRDVASRRVLRRYERWRKGHNLLMRGAMDGFKWLFESPRPIVQLARGFGLRATDQLMPVKRLIMRNASGLSGELPALARRRS
jgi:2-octaprenylphenol hydroxylase